MLKIKSLQNLHYIGPILGVREPCPFVALNSKGYLSLSLFNTFNKVTWKSVYTYEILTEINNVNICCIINIFNVHDLYSIQ